MNEDNACNHLALCPTCGPVTSCDEDRCCSMCGADIIVVADPHSADMLIAELAEARDAGRREMRSEAADVLLSREMRQAFVMEGPRCLARAAAIIRALPTASPSPTDTPAAESPRFPTVRPVRWRNTGGHQYALSIGEPGPDGYVLVTWQTSNGDWDSGHALPADLEPTDTPAPNNEPSEWEREIEGRLATATPGPLRLIPTEQIETDADVQANGCSIVAQLGGLGVNGRPVWSIIGPLCGMPALGPYSDGDLFAHAPTDLRRMLDLVADLRQNIARGAK